MKRFLVFMSTTILIVTTVFIGCSKQSSGGSDSPAPVGIVGIGQNCMVGQIIAPDGTCMNPGNCGTQGTNWGYDPNTNSCVQGTLVTQNYYNQYSSNTLFGATLNVTNSSVLQQMISDYTGGCTFKWLVGGPDYSYYTSNAFIEIQTDNVESEYATVTIGAGTQTPQSMYPYIPMSFSAQVSDINNSTGLAIWANGYAGTCSGLAVGSNGLQVNINNGTFTNSSMYATLSYRGTQFATANLYAF